MPAVHIFRLLLVHFAPKLVDYSRHSEPLKCVEISWLLYIVNERSYENVKMILKKYLWCFKNTFCLYPVRRDIKSPVNQSTLNNDATQLKNLLILELPPFYLTYRVNKKGGTFKIHKFFQLSRVVLYFKAIFANSPAYLGQLSCFFGKWLK